MNREKVFKEIGTQNWIILFFLGFVSFFFAGSPFTLGVILGGLIIIANFSLLQYTIRGAFSSDCLVEAKKKSIIAKYYFRLAILGIIIYILLANAWVDPIGLAMKETGVVPLPGDRVLKVTPRRIAGNRVELKLVILKKKRQIFQTVIQLLNHGNIIVGGPKYKNGYLLFNISASF